MLNIVDSRGQEVNFLINLEFQTSKEKHRLLKLVYGDEVYNNVLRVVLNK